MKNTIYQNLVNKPLKLCVLATATPQGKPECAVLAYAVNSDLSLILSTHTTSRKWSNIKANKQVAITLGQSFAELYIQYEGTAELITEGEEFKHCEELFFTANPQAKQFQNSETAFIKVKPSWIKSTDFSMHPPEITEIVM